MKSYQVTRLAPKNPSQDLSISIPAPPDKQFMPTLLFRNGLFAQRKSYWDLGCGVSNIFITCHSNGWNGVDDGWRVLVWRIPYRRRCVLILGASFVFCCVHISLLNAYEYVDILLYLPRFRGSSHNWRSWRSKAIIEVCRWQSPSVNPYFDSVATGPKWHPQRTGGPARSHSLILWSLGGFFGVKDVGRIMEWELSQQIQERHGLSCCSNWLVVPLFFARKTGCCWRFVFFLLFVVSPVFRSSLYVCFHHCGCSCVFEFICCCILVVVVLDDSHDEFFSSSVSSQQAVLASSVGKTWKGNFPTSTTL